MNDHMNARPSERTMGVTEAEAAREELYSTPAQLRARPN